MGQKKYAGCLYWTPPKTPLGVRVYFRRLATSVGCDTFVVCGFFLESGLVPSVGCGAFGLKEGRVRHTVDAEGEVRVVQDREVRRPPDDWIHGHRQRVPQRPRNRNMFFNHNVNQRHIKIERHNFPGMGKIFRIRWHMLKNTDLTNDFKWPAKATHFEPNGPNSKKRRAQRNRTSNNAD